MRHPLRLVIALIGVAVLLFVADRVAASLAAERIADRIERSEDLASKPDVTVRGFPFLTQAFAGKYSDIEVKIDGLQARTRKGREVNVATVTTHLHGVHVPIGDAFSGRVHQVHIDHAVASANVTYSELNRALAGTGISVSPGKSVPLVDVTATLSLSGRDVQASATCEVSGTDGGITLVPRNVKISTGGLKAAITDKVSDVLRLTMKLPRLPFRVEVTGVDPGGEGIVVHAGVDDVVVGD